MALKAASREYQRIRKSGTVALTEPEATLLLSKIGHIEDKALLALAMATGMRREDVVAVHLKDVDLENRLVSFWESKKRRPWSAWFGEDTAVTLEQHIHGLPKGTPWLFPSPRDPKKHLSSRQAYNILQSWLERAGLKRRPFHALRATCIKLLQKRGISIEQVMKQTGDTFRTIKEHYDTPSDDEMREAFRAKGL